MEVPFTTSRPLLLPDKQSNSASLETLLALLQAEGAKIEEDTEVRPSTLAEGPSQQVCFLQNRGPHLSVGGRVVQVGIVVQASAREVPRGAPGQ